MISDLVITILSLITGAFLAAISGIFVSTYTDRKRENKKLRAFILEFRLRVNWLYEHMGKSKNIHRNGLEFVGYYATPLVKTPVFHQYDLIAQIPGIDIERYYKLICTLEKIDVEIARPIANKSTESFLINPLIITYFQKFDEPYLTELNHHLDGLKI